MNILKRLCEYWLDKKLADKCGLAVKDMCVHESDSFYYDTMSDMYPMNGLLPYHDFFICKCIKCGEFYR